MISRGTVVEVYIETEATDLKGSVGSICYYPAKNIDSIDSWRG